MVEVAAYDDGEFNPGATYLPTRTELTHIDESSIHRGLAEALEAGAPDKVDCEPVNADLPKGIYLVDAGGAIVVVRALTSFGALSHPSQAIIGDRWSRTSVPVDSRKHWGPGVCQICH